MYIYKFTWSSGACFIYHNRSIEEHLKNSKYVVPKESSCTQLKEIDQREVELKIYALLSHSNLSSFYASNTLYGYVLVLFLLLSLFYTF